MRAPAALASCCAETTMPCRPSAVAVRAAAAPRLTPALYLLDRTGGIGGWKGAAERESGRGPEEVRGLAREQMSAPERGQPRLAACLRTAARQGRCGSHGWFTRQDGSRAAVNLTAERIRAPAGEPPRFAPSMTDSAAGQRGGDAPAVSERQFRLLGQGVAGYAIYM